MGEEISVQIEINEPSKMIDPYYCAIKALISGKLETVSHIPREVFFFIGGEEGRVDGYVLSTRYRLSLIPSGGLEMPLTLTFRSLSCNTQKNVGLHD